MPPDARLVSKDGHYVLADWEFPQAFTEWPALLKATLRDYPSDPQITRYLAKTEAILERRRTTTIYAGRSTSREAPLLPE